MGATSSSTDRRCLAAPTHVMDSAPDEKRGGKDCEVDQSDYSQPVAGVGGTHEGGSACVEHGWRTVHMRIFRIVCAVSSGTSSLCIKKKKKKKKKKKFTQHWNGMGRQNEWADSGMFQKNYWAPGCDSNEPYSGHGIVVPRREPRRRMGNWHN